MLKIRVLSISVWLLGVLFYSSLSAEDGSGWKYLFNGTTTEAWLGFSGGDFPSHRWVIEEGCLKASKQKRRARGVPRGGRMDLVTAEEFTDFELEWEWRIPPRGNSGVKYLVQEIDGGPIGHEYQLLDNENRSREPRHSTAALYDLLRPTATAPKPAGEFNRSRIVIRGNHVEHWLNGAKILAYELGSEELLKAISESKFKDIPGFGTKFRTRILLQDYGDEVWFRNMRIRELSTAE